MKTVQLVIQNYFKHNVGRNAAALAYYMLFALFPVLIFVSNLIGLLNFNISTTIPYLQQFLPRDVVKIIVYYLQYASETSSGSLLGVTLFLSLWFPARATKGLMDGVRLAYGLDKPDSPIRYLAKQIFFTVLLLLVIGLTLFFSILGKHVVGWIYGLLPANLNLLSDIVIQIWHYFRFVPIGVFMFAALGVLYQWALDERQDVRCIRPGILLALSGWMLASVMFSFYVENFANYSIIYGTLGAIIVLMIWLYITATMLLLGAELNAALKDRSI